MSYQVSLESSYRNQLNGVGLFHDVFGHPHETSPVLDVFENNMKLVNFRISLISEETKEFADEIKNNRLIHAIDAICDTIYVVTGTYHAIGCNFPHTNTDELYKFEPVENGFYDSVLELESISIQNSIQLFESLIEGLKTSASKNDYDGFVQILHTIHRECYNVSRVLKFNVDLMFNVVQHSNMTKVCETEELAQQSVEWYKQNESRYADPSYRKSTSTNYWIIYDRATSKSLKSMPYWQEPEPMLQKVLEESYQNNNMNQSVVSSV